MMTLPVDKKQFFKLLLAFYFLFFSISPLTYALSDKQALEVINATVQKSQSSIKSVHLPIRASVTERRSSPEETPYTKGKTPVLVKKKRAIVPEDPTEKISSSLSTSAPKNDVSTSLAPMACRSNGTTENILEINKGFNPLYAGNSPPVV